MPTVNFYLSEEEYNAFLSKLPKGLKCSLALIRLAKGVINGKITFAPNNDAGDST